MLQACKPDSVPYPKVRWLSFICSKSYLNESIYLPFLASRVERNCERAAHILKRFRFKNQGLHGISAYKVYPYSALLSNTVSSYLTFSPSSCRSRTVIFCGTVCCTALGVVHPAIHRCIALCCPDFPPIATRRR